MSDERWQEELEQERMWEALAVLQRVRNSILYTRKERLLSERDDEREGVYGSLSDLYFLAAELGITTEFKKEMT